MFLMYLNSVGSRLYLVQLKEKLKPHGIPIHVDGARVLNAAVALNVSPKEVVKDADSVSFCFSKVSGRQILLVCQLVLLFQLHHYTGGNACQTGLLTSDLTLFLVHQIVCHTYLTVEWFKLWYARLMSGQSISCFSVFVNI